MQVPVPVLASVPGYYHGRDPGPEPDPVERLVQGTKHCNHVASQDPAGYLVPEVEHSLRQFDLMPVLVAALVPVPVPAPENSVLVTELPHCPGYQSAGYFRGWNPDPDPAEHWALGVVQVPVPVQSSVLASAPIPDHFSFKTLSVI
jgi:hypothetical protein